MRESLFGTLETWDAITDARVLDLYAGSGALALEALSRGAASADLVELSRPAAQIVRSNATKVAKATGAGAARVHQQSATAFLRSTGSTWDLVFIDPPYDVTSDDVDTVLELLAPHLAAEAVVLVERAKRAVGPRWAGAGLEALRDKTYGDTTLWWGQPSASSQS